LFNNQARKISEIISAGRAQSSLPEQLSCRRRVSRCVAGYAAGYSTEVFAKNATKQLTAVKNATLKMLGKGQLI
jgi:hypothetical protein